MLSTLLDILTIGTSGWYMSNLAKCFSCHYPSCWLGNRKGIRSVKNWVLVFGDDILT